MFPHDEVPSVAIVGIGDPEPVLRKAVADILESTFGARITDGGAIEPPVTDGDSEPHFAGSYIEAAESAVDGDPDLVVGVTDRDLSAPGKTFVFGLWTHGGRAGVLSTARLFDDGHDREKGRDRLRKVVLKGAGVLFGLESHPGCVMAGSPMVDDLDVKPAEFCEDCTELLGDGETAPAPPYWHLRDGSFEEFETAIRWADGDVRLTEYPWIALGAVVLGLEQIVRTLRLDRVWIGLRRAWPGRPSVTLSRDARALIHETYRHVRFWWKILTFLLAYVFVAGGLANWVGLDGASDVQIWLILAGSLPVAWLLSELVNTILAGLVEGFDRGLQEELGAEE